MASVKVLENVEEIAAVPGVSAIMFGPGDFMVDAGCDLTTFGAPNPVFDAAVAKFAAAAKMNNLPLFGYVLTYSLLMITLSSIHLDNSRGANSNSATLSAHMIPSMIEQGYRAITVAFDLWGFSNMVKEKLDQATEYASKNGKKKEE